MSKIRTLAVVGAAVLALAAGVACGGGATPTPGPTSIPTQPTTTRPTTAPTSRPPVSSAPPVSVEQRNAARDAQSYLNMEGFSRKGLIHQLSSDSGDGYTVKAATAAVDSLHIDYNEQAARAAKGYLEMQPFSRSGLIHQLEASAGDGFTHSQAVYGVTKAGL